jgi:hypothetical protein
VLFRSLEDPARGGHHGFLAQVDGVARVRTDLDLTDLDLPGAPGTPGTPGAPPGGPLEPLIGRLAGFPDAGDGGR